MMFVPLSIGLHRQTALTPLTPAAKVCGNFSCMDAGKTLTDDCKKELADFRIELGESINKNLPLGKDQALQQRTVIDLGSSLR